MPTAMAYTTATTAASVGVKTPNLMPPTIMTGSKSAHMPCVRADFTSFSGIRGAGASVLLRLNHHHTRSEEHTSELQSLMRISYAVFCLKKKKNTTTITHSN